LVKRIGLHDFIEHTRKSIKTTQLF